MQHGDPKQQESEHKRTNGEYDHQFKIVLFGDSYVGKTSLLLQYANGKFPSSTEARDIDFRTVTRDITNQRIKLQIWDTVTQKQFRIANNNYRSAQGAVIAFDMTDEDSFKSVSSWMNYIARSAPENISVILVGTKSDLVSKQVITPERAKKLAQELDIPFVMVSAKDNVGLEVAFNTLANKILNEQIKPKLHPAPAPIPVPATHSTGIGRKISNFLLWPFKKIWDGVKFIGRELAAVKAFFNIFHRSQNNAEQQSAGDSREIKTSSTAITARYQLARQEQQAQQAQQSYLLAPFTAESVMTSTPSVTHKTQLEQQKEEAQLQADIAALKRQAAAHEEEAAILIQRKTQAELDAISTQALLNSRLKAEQKARSQNNIVTSKFDQRSNGEFAIGPM